MRIEYQFVGEVQDNIKVADSQAVPRKGEEVLFINEAGEETCYTVKHVYHVLEDDKPVHIQIVLAD